MAIGEHTRDLIERLQRMQHQAETAPAFVAAHGIVETPLDLDRWRPIASMLVTARLERNIDFLTSVRDGYVPEEFNDVTDQEATAMAVAAAAHVEGLQKRTTRAVKPGQAQSRGRHAATDTAEIRLNAKPPRHAAPEDETVHVQFTETNPLADTIVASLGEIGLTLVLQHPAIPKMPEPTDAPTEVIPPYTPPALLMGTADQPKLIISLGESDQV